MGRISHPCSFSMQPMTSAQWPPFLRFYIKFLLVYYYSGIPTVVAQNSTIPPTNVGGAAMARTRTALYFCGGYVDSAAFQTTNQFYRLDLSVSWKSTSPAWQRLANGPSSAMFPAAFSSDEKTLVTFRSGGPTGNNPSIPYMWQYSVEKDQWTTIPNIQVQDPNRDGLIAITDPINNAVYVPRGAQQPDYSLMDIYEFQTGTLRTIPIADPDNVFYGRQYNTGVWSSYLKAIIFYGGYGSFGRAENVTAYDPARNTYTSLKSPGTVLPASRADHCAAISDDGTFMIIYGGRPYTGTLHILDLKTMGWKEGALGEARMYHNCAIAGNLFITWGGQNEQNVVGVRAPTLPVRIYNITSDRWVDEYVPPESYRSSAPPGGNGSKDESKSGNNGVVIGASVAAVVVVLAGIIAVAIYRRRRRRHHSHGNGSRLTSPSYEAGGDGRETKALTTAVDANDDGQPQHFHQQHAMAGDVYHHPHNHHSFTAPPLSSAVSRPTTIGAPQLLHEHELQVLNGADTPTTIASSTAVQSPVQYFPSPSTLGSSSPTVTVSSPTPSLSGTTVVASSAQQLVMPPIAQPSWQQQQQQQQQIQQQPVAGHQFERNAMVDLRASTASTTSKSPHAVVARPNYGFYDATTTQNNPHAILE